MITNKAIQTLLLFCIIFLSCFFTVSIKAIAQLHYDINHFIDSNEALLYIPPEILDKFDKAAFDGSRPTFYYLSKEQIWDLRESPLIGEKYDYIILNFNYEKLSTPQIEILRDWAKLAGPPIYFGTIRNSVSSNYWRSLYNEKLYYQCLKIFGILISTFYEHKVDALTAKYWDVEPSDHPIFSDVSDIELARWAEVKKGLPVNATKVLSSPNGGAILGYFTWGNRTVVFNFIADILGRDMLRFELNLKQWLLGLPIPGPADVSVKGPVNRQPDRDTLLMRNGDVLTGSVVSEQIMLNSHYGRIGVSLYDVFKIEIVDYDSLKVRVRFKNGDVINGYLTTKMLLFKPAYTGKVLSIPITNIVYLYIRE